MTKESYSKAVTNRNDKTIINTLNQLLDALEGFKDNYTKRFNFGRLMEHLKVPKAEIDDLIYLLLTFQETFNDVFKDYLLKKKIENGNLYLIAKKKKNTVMHIPAIITIRRSILPVFSDLINLFKYVKRGKGFDLEANGTNLLRKIKAIQKEYPYLLKVRENGLIYPSELGLKLGEVILSYNKSNKEFVDLLIDNHTFKVIDDQ